MGSTQNVGSSVNCARTPAAYDSSPILRARNAETRKVVGGWAMNALHLETQHSQFEARIHVLDLGHDEVLDGDIVLCH